MILVNDTDIINPFHRRINNSTTQKINNIYEEILAKGYESYRIFYLGLYGSQNYHLDTDKSDIDCECFIFPTNDDIIFGKSFYSKIITTSYGQCVIKDIRAMFNELRKSSPNILEALNSPYALYNEDFGLKAENFIVLSHCYFERLNSTKILLGLKGMMDRLYPNIDTNPKAYANVFRICEMLNELEQGTLYKDTLVPRNVDWLYKIKAGKEQLIQHDIDTLRKLYTIMSNGVKIRAKDMRQDETILEYINHTQKELIERYIKLYF